METTLQLPSESSSGLLPGLEDIGAELLTVEDRKRRGHTGAGIQRDERRVELVRELLGLGVGKERIAKLAECSVSTVVILAGRMGEDVVRGKKDLAALARQGAAGLVRRIAENPGDVPIGQAAVTAGILIDKADQLEGSVPTLVVEHRHSLSHADLNAMIAALPAQPVCGGESGGQKGIAGGGEVRGLVVEAELVESPESGDSARQEGGAQ